MAVQIAPTMITPNQVAIGGRLKTPKKLNAAPTTPTITAAREILAIISFPPSGLGICQEVYPSLLVTFKQTAFSLHKEKAVKYNFWRIRVIQLWLLQLQGLCQALYSILQLVFLVHYPKR